MFTAKEAADLYEYERHVLESIGRRERLLTVSENSQYGSGDGLFRTPLREIVPFEQLAALERWFRLRLVHQEPGQEL